MAATFSAAVLSVPAISLSSETKALFCLMSSWALGVSAVAGAEAGGMAGVSGAAGAAFFSGAARATKGSRATVVMRFGRVLFIVTQWVGGV